MQNDPQWEQKLLTELATAALKERKAARRWGIFFKLLMFLYIFFALAIWLAMHDGDLAISSSEHTAVVEIKGVISDESQASAGKIISGLKKAFEHKGTKGVVIRINSPGGSPVQSAYIHDEILRLREKYPKIPVYAVIADICASGGYYVAVAADKIYADRSSLVGSVGVLMNGFGFVDAMQKLGVERRLLTAGKHKGILDPFSPLDETEKTHVQGILDHLHQNFIDVVKKGRGIRLKEDEKLFSGLFWSGVEGKELGLIDDFGSTSYVAREVIGAKEMVNFTPKEDLLERFANSVGASAAQTLMGWGGVTLR